MTTDIPSQLQSIDPAVLADVVRQDQCSPAFEITSWSINFLSDKGLMNPDGLILFKGEGCDTQGSRPWSVVLKLFNVPPHPDLGINSLWHWSRELSVSRSDLIERLPRQLLAPRFYGTTEWTGHVGLWMEHIAGDAPDTWGIDEYAFAARRLGQYNAACLHVQLPDYPWLARTAIEDWLAAWEPVAGWDNPYVQRYLSQCTGERIRRLWSERQRFLSALDAVPQVFSHGDAHRRNLIPRRNALGERELVAVDWSLCRIGPLGADPAQLVVTAAFFFDWRADDLQKLEAQVYAEYLAGLMDENWHGDLRMIHLAFTSFFALWCGVFAPRGIDFFTQQDMQPTAMRLFGCHPDDFAAGLVTLSQYALDKAGEARQLMQELNLP